jgi:hypothetical protein
MIMEKYKVINGISFHAETPQRVCNILANYCGNLNQRVRIFYGDIKTGKDWLECHDSIGYVGKSCGKVSVPLLLIRKDSTGGCAISDDCIVKITIDKKVVYKHSNYYCPIEISGNEIYDTETGVCIFRNPKGVGREFDFLNGTRNAH